MFFITVTAMHVMIYFLIDVTVNRHITWREPFTRTCRFVLKVRCDKGGIIPTERMLGVVESEQSGNEIPN